MILPFSRLSFCFSKTFRPDATFSAPSSLIERTAGFFVASSVAPFSFETAFVSRPIADPDLFALFS